MTPEEAQVLIARYEVERRRPLNRVARVLWTRTGWISHRWRLWMKEHLPV